VSACHCTHRYRPDAPLAHPRWHRWAAAVLAGLPALAAASVFQAEGSDTGAGLGARQVALGGTGVASAEDVHAVCYKPGGLASVAGGEIAVSRQLHARLHPVNFLGVAWQLPLPGN